MKHLKWLVLVAALLVNTSAFALTGDEQVEFTEALSSGNVAVVKKYLDNGVDVNDNYFAWSALQIAANKGQAAVCKLLLEKGAAIDYKHPLTKMTALHLAAYDGFVDTTKLLLSKGANPNVKMRGGVTILRAVRDLGNKEMEEILVTAGAKDDGCQGNCE